MAIWSPSTDRVSSAPSLNFHSHLGEREGDTKRGVGCSVKHCTSS